MKKVLSLVLCLILALSFVGCAPSEESEELVNYINEDLADLSELETAFVESYESVRGENYVDDTTMYQEYSTNTIDKLEAWDKKANEVMEDINDSKIREVHTIYTKYIAKYRNAINTMLGALEDQDRDKVTEANDLLTEAETLATEYLSELEALAEEYNVEFERE